MIRSTVVLFALLHLLTPRVVSAQTYAPTVTMRVTAPDGTTQEISARESSVATLALKDGTVYELRPTIQDEPFSRVTVSIFKAATATDPGSSVGDVQVTAGGPAVASNSKPNFRVAVLKIEGARVTHPS